MAEKSPSRSPARSKRRVESPVRGPAAPSPAIRTLRFADPENPPSASFLGWTGEAVHDKDGESDDGESADGETEEGSGVDDIRVLSMNVCRNICRYAASRMGHKGHHFSQYFRGNASFRDAYWGTTTEESCGRLTEALSNCVSTNMWAVGCDMGAGVGRLRGFCEAVAAAWHAHLDHEVVCVGDEYDGERPFYACASEWPGMYPACHDVPQLLASLWVSELTALYQTALEMRAVRHLGS